MLIGQRSFGCLNERCCDSRLHLAMLWLSTVPLDLTFFFLGLSDTDERLLSPARTNEHVLRFFPVMSVVAHMAS